MFAAENRRVAFAVYWIGTPVLSVTAEKFRVTFTIFWIVSPVESQMFAAEKCRVAFAVYWIGTPVVTVNDATFNIAVAHTEFWVIMIVITRAAFFGAFTNAVVILPIEFLIATLIFGVARCAICVFSPSLLWTAIDILVAFTSERVSEPSVIICSTAIIS